MIESTKVERRGCGTLGDLGIWDDSFVEPLSRLVTFIKQQNSVASIQLGHSGRKARAKRPWEGDGPLQRTAEIEDWDAWGPVAPSAIAHSEKWPVPRELERHEVKDLVQAWGDAARRAAERSVGVAASCDVTRQGATCPRAGLAPLLAPNHSATLSSRGGHSRRETLILMR